MANSLSQPAAPALSAIAALDELADLRNWLVEMAADRSDAARLDFARGITAAVMRSYWRNCCAAMSTVQPIREPPVELHALAAGKHLQFADACTVLPAFRAFFEIGELYTSLLPTPFRSQHGVYYTPPELVAQLLDHASREGIDWATARVLDPSCGGAAFLAYLAERILTHTTVRDPESRLQQLEERLVGIELDPFAAWLSAVLVDIVALPVSAAAGRKLKNTVKVADSLELVERHQERFDLVVGNPPYGKVKLAPEKRARFTRSLFGHANLYGMFTDAAVSYCRPGGCIAYVTPTSFLGGEYFKNLRKLLREKAPLVHASFVENRDGVFSGVLQETMLAVFRKGARSSRQVRTDVIDCANGTDVAVRSLGRHCLSANTSEPWVLPRRRSQTQLVRSLSHMRSRLIDYGYRVATGQLVWNRHKSQLRTEAGSNCYPIIWAEAILPNGSFVFRAESRNHFPYIHLEEEQDFLINHEPCVLVQRTTSKEQSRRLIATTIPNEFVVKHPGYVVENHVNMLVPTVKSPPVSLGLLTRLLNSGVVDEAFRCISGSVAVSAYELESLPLPALHDLLRTGGRFNATPAAWFEAKTESLYYGC
jgi:adenine-specific DNA-methyltransferase